MRTFVAAAVLAGAVASHAEAREPAAAAGAKTVRAQDIAFHPARLGVTRGTRVTWRFLDPNASHTVTSRGKPRFRSSGYRLDGTYSVTFKRPGTYRYVCRIHPNMVGRVVVR